MHLGYRSITFFKEYHQKLSNNEVTLIKTCTHELKIKEKGFSFFNLCFTNFIFHVGTSRDLSLLQKKFIISTAH